MSKTTKTWLASLGSILSIFFLMFLCVVFYQIAGMTVKGYIWSVETVFCGPALTT